MCLIERKKVLIYITDQIFDKNLLNLILSDLICLMNNGGLPIRIFNQNLFNELSTQLAHISHSKNLLADDEWQQRKIISNNIQTNLHVFFSANTTSLKMFQVRFLSLLIIIIYII